MEENINNSQSKLNSKKISDSEKPSIYSKVFKIEGLINTIKIFLDNKSYINFKNTNKCINSKISKLIYINKELESQSITELTKIKNITKIKFSGDITLDPLIEELNPDTINEIEIEGNNCDCNCLTKLNNVKILRLYTQKADFAFLEKMKNLEVLFLRIYLLLKKKKNEKKIENPDPNIFLQPINKLQRLQILDIYHLKFDSIAIFSELENLEIINLSRCTIKKDFEYLAQFKRLKKLDLSYTNVDDISFLEKLTELIELNITFCKNIENIRSISNLNKLKNLSMGYITSRKNENRSINLSYIENLITLRYLDINNNNVENEIILSNLINLINLDISNTSITDIGFAEKLYKLDSLNISHNNIEDFQPLTKLLRLETLLAVNVDLKDITFIESLINLRHLDIKSNRKLFDFSPISKLKKIKTINLWATKIRDHLDTIDNFDHLVIFYLNNNDVNKKQIIELKEKNVLIRFV